MRLEVGTFPVSEIVEGSQTHWNDGVLEIDLGELRSIVSEDPNVGNFEIDIVQPGDDVRVINYMDIV
ncbi:MAG: glycine/sarcosine/betaine reductase component B subunit, partial [SAR202 cluster bacterium]|nr:glycine/sarcosine/betaine reductase component B subunit [SAR202 cluster bacterium]